MHWFWTGLLGLIAFGWLVAAMDLARGALVIPALSGYQKQLRRPEGDRYKGNPGGGGERDSKEYAGDLPRVSILFSALDEAEKLPAALATFLAQDYPDYEVIAVDDRSADATGSILDAAARANSHLKVVHVTSLPPGWLGKPHGLQHGIRTFQRRMAGVH